MQRALLILLVAAAYLLLAGATSAALVALLVIASALALTAPAKILTVHAHTRALDRALLLVGMAMALQLLPLPSAALDVLSPNRQPLTATLRLAPLGGSAEAWGSLSIDARATIVALGEFALGVLSYWGARAAFGAGGSTRVFCRVLTFLAAVFAVLALVQRASASRTVLFLIEPEARSANPFGAFVNRNHFGAWLLLACGPISGYFIARLRTHPRHLHFRAAIGQVMRSGIVFNAAAVILTIGTLLSLLSRSAVAGLGAAALTGWWLGRPRLSIERTSLPAILGFIGAVLLVFVLFFDIDGWATRFQQSLAAGAELSRLAIWRETSSIVRDFWLTGTGAGTYSDAMTHYQESRVWVGSMQRWAHFNTAHSHYLQLLAEGGVLLALPVAWALYCLAFLGIAAIRADKGEMFWVRIGAAAGLAGLAVQSIWEVALTMPANAVLAGVLTGLLLHHRDPHAPGPPATTPELLITPRPTPARRG